MHLFFMILRVKVIPNSKQDDLRIVGDQEYVAHVTALPAKGRANIHLVSLLAQHFGVPKRSIVIKTPVSREKVVEIQGL